ncbi:MAG: BTAD domain-containing putative transcriptional regulator [Desulfobacterales bacterium]|jgi:ATP/maltotriose-dependent transcriptional regulator MalT/DNA-binding SARP family transcriptional activator|nr:BTAD domain-containing putative transcriptional regulator [Desulfobacterales bacterium]
MASVAYLTPISGLLPPALVKRRRLMEKLRANRHRRLVLVAAQPAQGKTCLVAAYLSAAAIPTAWCRLPTATATAVGIWRLLAGALEPLSPPPATPLGAAVTAGGQQKEPDPARLAEALERLPRPSAVVFDGIDSLQGNPSAIAFIERLILNVPEGIQVFLISRAMPTLKLQRLRVSRQVLVLGNADLAFEEDEVREFLCVHHHLRLSDIQLRDIQREIDGWAGGLVLLAESLTRLKERNLASPGPEDPVVQRIRSEANGYFDEEVFSRQPAVVKDFLLPTALLEEVDPEMAADLTGLRRAEEILADLVARNVFTRVQYKSPGRDVYRYHPLFRSFLRTRARTDLPPQRYRRLLQRIGGEYGRRKRSDLAVGYFLESGDAAEAARAIKRAALDLTIDDRLAELGRWMEALPDTQYQADPWLVFWHAVAHRSPGGVKPGEELQVALTRFRNAGDLRGQCFAVAYLIETAVFQGAAPTDLAQWFTRAVELLQRVGTRPYFTYAKALLWRQIGLGHLFSAGPSAEGLSACRNAHLLARRIGDPHLQRSATILMASALAGLGEVVEAEAALAQDRAAQDEKIAPEYRAIARFAHLQLALLAGHLRQAEGLLETLREEIEAFGLLFLYPLLQEIWGMLRIQKGAHAEAEATVRHCRDLAVMMPDAARIEALALRLEALIHYYRGDFAAAARLSDQVVEKLDAMGCDGLDRQRAGLLCGIVHWHLGALDQARHHIETSLAHFLRLGSPIGAAECHMALALVAEAENQPAAVQAHLTQAFGIANEKGYHLFWVMRPADVARACQLAPALNPGPLAESSRHLLDTETVAGTTSRQTRGTEAPPKPPMISAAARRARLPRLEMVTLGEFAVYRDGRHRVAEPEWSGHLPKLLLKAIIVHGARDVPKEVLIDDLWPDTEPGPALQRFKVTLHRLRRALESRMDGRFRWAYVRLKDHLVSLDSELCTIDVQQFEQCCATLQSLRTGENDDLALALCRQACGLYRGDLLPEEPYLPWIEAKRNALRDLRVEVLGRMADLLEIRGRREEVMEVLAAMIEAAPAREDMLRRLMTLYQKRGQRLLALQAYEKFKNLLLTELDTTPDNATTQLYRLIQSGEDRAPE